MDDSTTWDLIHTERKAIAATLETLTPQQWATPSLCSGWTVQLAAGHILAGAEQTKGAFFRQLAANGLRFNTMMDRQARKAGALPTTEIVERILTRSTGTTSPPAPVMTMLGEVVVHSEDIRQPLGLVGTTSPEALVACLTHNAKAPFPIGGRKRVAGVRLVATDLDWEHGSGSEVSGPATSLLLAITGRRAGLDALTGPGVATLRAR